jgi:hypothetical protein
MKRSYLSPGAISGGAAFDPTTLFGVSDVGGYWTAASLSDMKSSYDGTGAITAADGTQVVGYVAEKSGKGTSLKAKHGFVGATDGVARPTLNSASGINYLSFDGSANRLADINYNDNSQGTQYTLNTSTGWTRVSVLRTISGADANGEILFAGSGASYDGGKLGLANTAGQEGRPTMRSTTTGPQAATSITGSGSTFFVVIEEFHGASSNIQVDAGAVITADTGTTNGSGLFIGCEIFSGGYSRLDWVETLQIGRLLTATEKNNLRTLFGSHIGKSI